MTSLRSLHRPPSTRADETLLSTGSGSVPLRASQTGSQFTV